MHEDGGVAEQRCQVEMKRLGQKTQAGYFKYDKSVGKGREPIPDPEVEKLFAEEAAKAGIAPRAHDDAEIRDRLVFALINRGAHLLEEGVALRPGDIDIVYVYGYGFPPHRGGPMWFGDQVGLPKVLDKMKQFQAQMGDQFKPAALLEKLVSEGKRFADVR